ncbi:MAG TPA: efflux RND transporter periplasmic adaptor subunit [Saprospiraceae bacterium]|nr:efflux RND transporter periplasmic adaptor subunit [Saprospiraceae bacterium]HPG05306.1 efflux RND transporter periplasmic adaptor subunit [Saprospiraceae bacterium]HPQ99624.1 efflux RND transporter periplasmic adaptor subunit [Saprospiraceae bacterium]HRV84227.1 efflux RND transporter periplasmic adaptor subunit [Saprospiraceae bacterium]
MDRKIEKKTWTWQRIVIIVAVVGIAAYLISTMVKSAGTSKLNVQAERLLLDTIKTDVFQEYIPVTGVVEPIKTIYLDAVEGGKVEERLVEDGAMVKKGQMILRLSNPDLMSNFLNQEANIISQINQIRNTSLLMEQQSLNLKEQSLNVLYQIDLTSKRLVRNKQLYASNVIAKVDLEEMEDEYENLLRRNDLLKRTIAKDSAYQALQQSQMESSLDLMQRNLEITRQSLENLVIKAPIDGQLSGLNLEIGELVTEGENIATLDNLENFKIQVRVDEYYISRVFLNQEGSFQFAGKWYNLRIAKIYPQVTNGAFLVDMVFTDETPSGIKRGQSVSVKLELSAEERVMLIARGGFYQTTGGNWVYVIDPSTGNARKRNIRLNRQNPNYYEVTNGLEEGEVVIVSSYENFGDKDELILK